ncbi:MAG: hypothetical protein ABI480_10640 [Chitinophagaceae bacterium]
MKKLINLFLLVSIAAASFAQSVLFQDNFAKGKMNTAWTFGANQWSVANLESISMLPSPDGNNFALTNKGVSGITVDIAAASSANQTQHLNFYYHVHSKDAKGTVELLFLDQAGITISSMQFSELKEQAKWTSFNEEFKVPSNTTTIRLKLGFHLTHSPITIYYQDICIGCTRRSS